jgi:hypothetical protein
MELATGVALLVAFVVVVVLIVRGQSPVIMLLLLAILWAALAGIGVNDIQHKILQGGGVQYASSVIVIVFGAWFAQILIQTGIAESVIRSAAELAGDRPLITAIVINLVTALLFTSMYGVGAAIAIGVVALPIMMSQGIPPRVAAPAFTMGVGAGMYVNPALFGTFAPLFPGIKYEPPWRTFWLIGMGIALCAADDHINLRRWVCAMRRQWMWRNWRRHASARPITLMWCCCFRADDRGIQGHYSTILLSIVLALVLTRKISLQGQPVQQSSTMRFRHRHRCVGII